FGWMSRRQLSKRLREVSGAATRRDRQGRHGALPRAAHATELGGLWADLRPTGGLLRRAHAARGGSGPRASSPADAATPAAGADNLQIWLCDRIRFFLSTRE